MLILSTNMDQKWLETEFLVAICRQSMKYRVKPYPANIFSQKCCLLFTPAAFIEEIIRLDFLTEANTMKPDQTAPLVHIVCNKVYLKT